jgi:hypothetical protein
MAVADVAVSPPAARPVRRQHTIDRSRRISTAAGRASGCTNPRLRQPETMPSDAYRSVPDNREPGPALADRLDRERRSALRGRPLGSVVT